MLVLWCTIVHVAMQPMPAAFTCSYEAINCCLLRLFEQLTLICNGLRILIIKYLGICRYQTLARSTAATTEAYDVITASPDHPRASCTTPEDAVGYSEIKPHSPSLTTSPLAALYANIGGLVPPAKTTPRRVTQTAPVG